MVLLGIDIGTTGCKSMMFDYSGNIIAQNYIEYDLINVGKTKIEQDARLWWDMTKRTVKQTIDVSGLRASSIKAISVSSQGISFVPIDKSGAELYNVISWLDTRADVQVNEIRKLFPGKSIFETTGKRISSSYTLPKLMWVRENLPEIYDKTHKFLMALDYITYKLTGHMVTDYSMASGTLMFNVSKRQWDERILSACHIDIHKLPQVLCTGSVVGTVKADVAAELGIDAETKVVLGAQDQKCAAIGSGIKKGIATVSLGTATAVSSIDSAPVFDKQMRVPCFALDAHSWVLESVICTSGVSLKWLKNLCFEDMDYPEIDRLAESASVGADGVYFYPHLEGASTPFWRDDIKGFIYGLSLSTSKKDVVRALMEGIAFQIRTNIELHQEINGNTIDEIRVFGGGSKSEIWCRLIADITGKTVSVLYTSETANLGAAIIAGMGIGVYKNLDDVLSNVKLIKEQYQPRKSESLQYDEIFKDYLKIQQKILS